jgi:hypothetical protein
MYAGQKKVGKDIERALKNTKSRTKSDQKKRELQKLFYIAKLIKKNKDNEKQ